MHLRGIRVFFVAHALTLALCGCGSDEPSLYPVRGVVSWNGEPVPQADIFFHPQFEGPGWIPVGKSADDGTFSISTRSLDDGAPAGRYKVTVEWRPLAEEETEAPNELPLRYADPKSTDLVVEVRDNSQESVNLQLQD